MPEATGSGGAVLPLCAVDENAIRAVYRASRELVAAGCDVEVVRVTPEPAGVDLLHEALARGELPKEVVVTDPFVTSSPRPRRSPRAGSSGRLVGRLLRRRNREAQAHEEPAWSRSPAVAPSHIITVPVELQRRVVESHARRPVETTATWPDDTPAVRERLDAEGRTYQRDVVTSGGELLLTEWIVPETGAASTVFAADGETGSAVMYRSSRAWQAQLVARRAGPVPDGRLVIATSEAAAALLTETPLAGCRTAIGLGDAVAAWRSAERTTR